MNRVWFKVLRTSPWRWLVALTAGLMAGCSPLAVINHVGSDDGIVRMTTHAYGAHDRQQLDVYTPRTPNGRVVVFIYGGSWSTGNRADYRFVAQTLTARGATVVIPDYRLYPDIRFPTFVEDAAAAVAWTREHAAEYGGDPAQIYLVGHSAGAHIATLIALDHRYLAAHAMAPTQLVGVVGLSTPADFAATLGKRYRPIFTDDAGLAAAQPVAYVNAAAPPLLLLHGADDTLVWPKNSENLAARQRDAGGVASVKIYPDMGHIGTVTPFVEWLGNKDALAEILRFLKLAK